jgi:hypothetical protein
MVVSFTKITNHTNMTEITRKNYWANVEEEYSDCFKTEMQYLILQEFEKVHSC